MLAQTNSTPDEHICSTCCIHACTHACVGPVSWRLAGGVLIVVASATSAGCEVLCVQVLGGRPPGDWVRAGAFLCTCDVCASASSGVGCDRL